MPSGCPCCGEIEEWHYQSGVINGEPIEPGEYWCDQCGFTYSEHVNHPMREAAIEFAPIAVANVSAAKDARIAELERTLAYFVRYHNDGIGQLTHALASAEVALLPTAPPD